MRRPASGRSPRADPPISRRRITGRKPPCWRSTTGGRSTGKTARSHRRRRAAGHEGNFLEAVKSRKKPNADVEIGRLSTMLCHLGNVSYKLGRDVRFDPKTEKFGDAEANKLLRKEYRAGYELPKV